jgi:hypothetical protein
MDTKIRIKLGLIEVDYEGSEAFAKDELSNVVSALIDLYKTSDISIADQSGISPAKANDLTSSNGSEGTIQATTSTLAAKLGCSSGLDLIIVAATRLTFVAGLPTFSRQNILDEMKTASGYYKQSYGANLSNYLQSLVKSGKLLETAKDIYSLSDTEKKEVGTKLAA